MAGIYVHIPFCKSRCIYCGFYSTTSQNEKRKEYIKAIIKEATLRKYYINNNNERAQYNTLYIGGGTPSTLSIPELQTLTNGISTHLLKENASTISEFTIECNPDDITSEYAKGLKDIGANRISLGTQTFSDNRLKFLNRRHNSAQIYQAINALRQAGIHNISIDLMFGFPDETIYEWADDLQKAISLNVEHISAYSLMYEEGTPLFQMLRNHKISQNSESNCCAMYESLIDMLTAAGYEHYEISNFAKPGYRSHHNSSYWNDTPYLGLGAAAHSYNQSNRQWNICNIDKYIESINNGILPAEQESINDATHYNDLITTALRTREGLRIENIEEPYRSYLIANAEKSLCNGNLSITDGRIHLTRKGLFISDDIMSDLIYV